MKYSDGFFVFHIENTGNPFIPNIANVTELWEIKGSIAGFDCYLYHWLIQDKDGFKSEFHEAPVWINNDRELAVIFLGNYKLISEAVYATSRKFGVNLIPYSLASRSTVMSDGNLVIAKEGINNTINKVKTTLLKNDLQRVSVIESVLVGE